MGIKAISSAFHLSRNTVRKYVRKFQESGLTTEQVLSMSEEKLQDMFLDGTNRSRVPSSRRVELDAVVPDNLKAAVSRSDRNEPIINEDFAALAEFYDMAVYPARARRPKDKALVENAVKLMYRSVYVEIEGMVFHDLDSLNAAIRVSLATFNDRRLSGRKESRRDLFEDTEKGFLQPLPAMRYQMKSRKTATVMQNSFVVLNKHNYSVPKEYIGKRVDLIKSFSGVSATSPSGGKHARLFQRLPKPAIQSHEASR